MAPIKFEENIKEKLNERAIQPSNTSWQKLSQRLEEQEHAKSKKGFWWFSIAASIFLLIFSSLFFYNKEQDKDVPKIVKTQNLKEKQEGLLKQNHPDQNHKIVQTEPNIETEISKENKTNNKLVTSKTTINKDKLKQKAIVKKALKDKERFVVTEHNKSKTIKEEITPLEKNSLIFEDVKIKEILAEISTLNTDGTSATDREIDALLKVAHKEIVNNRIYNENIKTVSAETLLQDVESDLEQSFRSKVLKALKSSYNSVKTSVAERNN